MFLQQSKVSSPQKLAAPEPSGTTDDEEVENRPAPAGKPKAAGCEDFYLIFWKGKERASGHLSIELTRRWTYY